METEAKKTKLEKQRKFMLVLPVITLPFLTLLFFLMGGGKVDSAEGQVARLPGFNNLLPDARPKDDEPKDKMGYYDQAAMDSARFEELKKNDPNYQASGQGRADPYTSGDEMVFGGSSGRVNTSLYSGGYNDQHSEKIYQKLALLNRELNNPSSVSQNENYGQLNPAYSRGLENPEVDRLEKMMLMMSQSEGRDPEMDQLSSMLDKIIDIQHPERLKERIENRVADKKGIVYTVTTESENPVTQIRTGQDQMVSGFYSLQEENLADEQNAIQAAVHENQTIVTGSTVKLRLLTDIRINGKSIPKDNFIYGKASLEGERLTIEINSIRYKNNLFPVQLKVYDLDGLDGIQIPGAITRDVAKQSADRTIQSLGMASLDPSIAAQAAGAGIEAVKSLVSQKVKLVKVVVKAGYKVLIRDQKKEQSEN
ncbi:conjugative transposon protein TraM [Sphingobacterium spiritivorum]|uniref:conjugative transposon protein TraM n=1 Tax=Sphingobacterium spiritivorum TaxID=258 RepID=UPI003DA2F7CA